ncbi:MAG: cation transporter [Xanthomonadales bacterium]|nr:cation transporter [Xanthomonadales bacterium]
MPSTQGQQHQGHPPDDDHARVHGHSHDDTFIDHHHGPGDGSSGRRLTQALVVVALVMVAEVVGGIISGSLALLADAAHMATDAFALALAVVAVRLKAKTPGPRHTFGFRRAPVLAAFVNGILLFGVALWIVVEAIDRFTTPQPILAGPMLAVAVVGLLANLFTLWLLHGGDSHDLNLRGALLHVLGDLLGSVAAIVAAIVIWFTGWTPADPILSVLVALLVLGAAWRLVRSSAFILLESAPGDLDGERIAAELPDQVSALQSVHHLHVWSLAPKEVMLTCHARIDADADSDAVLAAMRGVLRERWKIDHVTIEIERERCADEGECPVGA